MAPQWRPNSVRERAYVAAAGRELLEASPFRKDLAEQEADAGF
jgi:hypothetical protein